MKKIKYLILLFLAILGSISSVKAVTMDYDFAGYNKATQVQFGLYNNTTLVQNSLTTCTSSNDGFCAFSNSADLPSGDIVFNNLRFVIRGTDSTTFTSGGQYKMSFFFLSQTSDYYINQSSLTNTTGVSYQNFTNWTSNDLGIISTNIIPIETQDVGSDTATLYRVDIVFTTTTSTISGFNVRLYRQSKSTWSSTPCDIELFRYFSITEMTPGSIDYSQDFNQVNQNINGLGTTITNNQNTNTQSIINSQNAIAEQQRLDNEACIDFVVDKNSVVQEDVLLGNNGSVSSVSGFGITDYLKFSNTRYLVLKDRRAVGGRNFCFYDSDKNLIGSCLASGSYTINNQIPVPSNAVYARFTIELSYNLPQYVINVCKNGNQALVDSLTDDNISEANSDAASFFNNFNTSSNGGISGIITAPLTAINRMLDNQCSPLSFTYRGQTVSFPCGTDTWNQLSEIRTFLNLTEGGALCYLILRKLFLLIDNLKNPDSDKVEVMSL